MKPRILLVDIESTPMKAWVYDLYETNVMAVIQESYMLCFAYQWLGGPVIVRSLPEFEGYIPDNPDDFLLVKELHKLLDEADIVIAHNGDRFDTRYANWRFSKYHLPPPSPYKTVDTLKVARKHAKFPSNKLGDLGESLGYGKKKEMKKEDIIACINGDPKAWLKMIAYNKQDVVLLRKIYLHFRPWVTNHPVIRPGGCPTCGSTNFYVRGRGLNKRGYYIRFQCKDCDKWFSGPTQKL